MKVFNSSRGAWADKVNFVDENNVLVGYDTSQCCCEDASWVVTPTKEPSLRDLRAYREVFDAPERWRFDPDYCEQHTRVTGVDDTFSLDGGEIATFRLVDDAGNEAFLHLFNIHNGYYSHGFTMDVGGRTIHSGSV